MQGWKRTFRAVLVANLVTTMGLQSILPFFPSHLEAMGLGGRGLIAVWTGVLFGAAPLAAALTGPIWGSLGDRVGRKAMVLRSLFATALFVGLMAWARSPLELLLLRFLQGAFSGVIAPSITLVSVGAPREKQGEVAGRLQAALAAGAIVGPLLGAGVSWMWGLRAVFLAVAALACLGACLVALCAREEGRLSSERRRSGPWNLLRRAKYEADELWRNPRLRAALALAFWIQFAVSATSPQMELHVRDLWSGSSALRHTLTGALFTAMAAASMLATPWWGRLGDRIGHRRALYLSALSTAAALLLHAFAPNIALLVAARLALGATMAGCVPCAYGVAAEETAIERRGGGFGIVFSARSFAIAFASLAGGWLSMLLGLRGLFAACALALLAAAWLERPRQGELRPLTRQASRRRDRLAA